MSLAESEASDTGPRPLSSDEGERRSLPGRIAARCWALLLARIYEFLSLVCSHCRAPMRLIAFILDPPVIERNLGHICEPVQAPAVLSARSPPQLALNSTWDCGWSSQSVRVYSVGSWESVSIAVDHLADVVLDGDILWIRDHVKAEIRLRLSGGTCA